MKAKLHILKNKGSISGLGEEKNFLSRKKLFKVKIDQFYYIKFKNVVAPNYHSYKEQQPTHMREATCITNNWLYPEYT